MIKNLKQIWNKWCVEGLKLPYAFNPETEKPSITLLTLYIATFVMFGSVLALHFVSAILQATFTTILIWTLAYVFYRLRRLDSFKIDLDDGEIELNSGEKDSTEKEEKETDE